MNVTNRSGLLVVRRRDWTILPSTEGRIAAISLHLREAQERYEGIDGELWPGNPSRFGFELRSGLALESRAPEVSKYVASLAADGVAGRVDCLRCEIIRDRQTEDWVGVELDVGYIESESSVYSVLFHEVLFGNYNELRSFAAHLNCRLLLDSMAVAVAVLEQRHALLVDGCDLEDDHPMDIIAVRRFETRT